MINATLMNGFSPFKNINRRKKMDTVERTVELHQEGLNCTQAILTAFGEKYNLDENFSRAIGRPMGGGIARQADMCGYLTGAMMILALANNQEDENLSRSETHGPVVELLQQFKKCYGHLRCKNLLQADISTPEGRKRIESEGLIAKHCYGFGKEVAQILQSLL